jgi:hypothetical protein
MIEGEKWKGRLGEAAMIVVSILLAFWIDAWWGEFKDIRDEHESLELVSRDLNAAIVQLTEFAEFTEQIGTEGLKAMEALSANEVHDHLKLSRMIQRASNRKTVALPTAANTLSRSSRMLEPWTLRYNENWKPVELHSLSILYI